MLHIAPESAFVPRLLKLKHLDYITADLYDPNVMVKMDITDIQYPSNSFDIIYCSHVLEHVADDRAAMREMHRVLKPTGWAVILVPVTAEVTVEETFSNNPSQREKQFGQHDHVRRYGYDFVNRLEDANFKVSQHDWQDVITKDELEYLGIPNGEIIYFCKKA